uniref:peptidylprolyl isomerase n=1 Tax=Helicotheca tamesis TaxID=374047 RepID=A0A7S2I6Z6_9STRA|mmetsp:Transcript_6386/g.8631  ORF Transcript_6386/g.8631 Transcript_6386/m.8631 type:complete len:238 (+) Transcript_6386:84-797(+)
MYFFHVYSLAAFLSPLLLIVTVGQTNSLSLGENRSKAKIDSTKPAHAFANIGQDRRNFLSISLLSLVATPSPASSLEFSTASSGLQWADAKVGSGSPPQPGQPTAIDYVMSTTGARYGTKIDSTTDRGAPYRWTLGDGTTIAGLEQAVLGGGGVPPMLPGGIRRVVIPSKLGYESLARPIPGMQFQDCEEGRGVGPIPPTDVAFAEYQRFKNIYCNANRPYQPDLVLDVKLYGKRVQ